MAKVVLHEGGRCDFFENLRDRSVTNGVEVGVYNGENASMLCRAVPTLTNLYCVDPYQTDIEGFNDFANNVQDVQDKRAELIQALITNGYIRGHLVRHSSVHAAELLAKYAPFDFVYIDANHAIEHVREDIAIWTPLVKVGGVVAGHDFCLDYVDSVVHAVLEFVSKNSVLLHVFKRDDIWCFVK
jgi:hypothetical protein